uniref:ATP synthase F0 subunit 8 n=1 Tax=Stephalia dilata TaxID=316222 RepID=UPI0026E3A059|nr:ATP synthase F0 subunit 8 [Stephalia dilata]WJJ69989.1 ATP synthase F0 subunit 8 [Stephalia dilata]
MSQLDMSISFYHIIDLILCFYIFIHLISIILVKYSYNKKVRLSNLDFKNFSINEDNLGFIKRILKI